MTAVPGDLHEPQYRSPGRRRVGPGLLVAPAAAGLAALALTPVAGLHQGAGAALIVLLAAAAYALVTRLVPGLDPVPAATLAALGSLAAIILAVVALAALSVPVSRTPMVAMVAVLAAGVQIAAETQSPVRSHRGGRRRWRPALFVVLATVATGLLVTDAGAVTARLAPHATPAPFTSFSFSGAAARWSQQLDVRAGQVVEVPLQVLNRTGRADVYDISYQLGSASGEVAHVDVAAGGQWGATVPVTMPATGCPTRLAFEAASSASTETLDVWLRWSDPACG